VVASPSSVCVGKERNITAKHFWGSRLRVSTARLELERVRTYIREQAWRMERSDNFELINKARMARR